MNERKIMIFMLAAMQSCKRQNFIGAALCQWVKWKFILSD
jgi:hypothetical protein